MSKFKGTVTISLEEYKRLDRIEKALTEFSKEFNHLTEIDYFERPEEDINPVDVVATVARSFSGVEEYVEKLNGIYIKHLEDVLQDVYDN